MISLKCIVHYFHVPLFILIYIEHTYWQGSVLGYMDVSIAEYGSDSWQLLAFTPDKYVHAQDHQQNYSAIVVSVINIIKCSVLLSRYCGLDIRCNVYETCI